MGYTPNNVAVYLAANEGALAGFYDAQFIGTPQPDDDFAQLADAWGQAFDTAWGDAGYTGYELASIQTCSMMRWQAQGPAESTQRYVPSAYSAAAAQVVALVQAANAQVVAQGINPNGGGSSSGGLIETVENTAAGPLGVGTLAVVQMIAAPSVAVAAGQKVIVWASMEYQAASSDTQDVNITQQIISGVAQPYDNCEPTVAQNTNLDVTRVVEITGLSAGNYVFYVGAKASGNSPAVTANNMSIVVAVVSV